MDNEEFTLPKVLENWIDYSRGLEFAAGLIEDSFDNDMTEKQKEHLRWLIKEIRLESNPIATN